eukprot:PhM_4_TR8419/c5_g1_i2/m.8326
MTTGSTVLTQEEVRNVLKDCQVGDVLKVTYQKTASRQANRVGSIVKVPKDRIRQYYAVRWNDFTSQDMAFPEDGKVKGLRETKYLDVSIQPRDPDEVGTPYRELEENAVSADEGWQQLCRTLEQRIAETNARAAAREREMLDLLAAQQVQNDAIRRELREISQQHKKGKKKRRGATGGRWGRYRDDLPGITERQHHDRRARVDAVLRNNF